MGGSSLAPEVIAQTAGVPLTILDSTAPGQVLAAIDGDAESGGLGQTVLVVSSKSGSTVETDSAKRAFEAAWRDLGIDPVERIVVVTDPGSPLDEAARAAGHRVFNADPTVGGRYSALTAFGLVPTGLAGADIVELLDEAEASLLELAIDSADNPGLVLAAAIAGGGSRAPRQARSRDRRHAHRGSARLDRAARRRVDGQGGHRHPARRPAARLARARERTRRPAGRAVRRRRERVPLPRAARGRDPRERLARVRSSSSGSTRRRSRDGCSGINPFDQPDVESAKTATRGLLDARPAPAAPAFTADGVEVRVSDPELAASGTVAGVLDALWARLPEDGYVVDPGIRRSPRRSRSSQGLRELVAADSGRPTTFGWGPRFLHSTGQYHKGGPANGVFLQILERTDIDLEIPGRPFTFGQLIEAQAAGDASRARRATAAPSSP